MSFAIFELLEELRLRLVVQVRVLRVLNVLEPDSRVDRFGGQLRRRAHALVDRQWHDATLAVEAVVVEFLLRLLHVVDPH